ncbi:alcohol dehydrogenase [Lachnellula suecica]|uniref:Alcohol dehydrogenase n=1 Tax=Lachnellula suecica TaxID=602035 RepID=A0A8T9C778_9HELO|nr:alcohol dehydrogenase [Lachnellula suecica]
MAEQTLTYLAGDPDGNIVVKTSKRAVEALEVLVKVTHSGLCGTDVHDRTSECGLGHEGVGLVEKIGLNVTSVKVGERVGWGPAGIAANVSQDIVSIAPSLAGKSMESLSKVLLETLWSSIKISYTISPMRLSPSMLDLCSALITVYEALDVAGAKPSDRVGIVGLGGLGHMAVQYAKAMGCDPVVFSRSPAKKEDALKLGAKEFHLIPSSPEVGLEVTDGIHVLLLCGDRLPNFEQFMPVLARRATIVPLIIQGEPLVIPYMPFMLPGHGIIASTEASRRNHIDALTFAARHNIRPWIQEFPMTRNGLAEALDLLEQGRVKYRAVLTAGLNE